jgi:hypothetical protein
LLDARPGAIAAAPPQVELIESIADTAERAIDPSGDGPCVLRRSVSSVLASRCAVSMARVRSA